MLLHLKAFALVIACTSHAGSCRFHHIGGSHLVRLLLVLSVWNAHDEAPGSYWRPADQHLNSCFLVARAAATSCDPIVKMAPCRSQHSPSTCRS